MRRLLLLIVTAAVLLPAALAQSATAPVSVPHAAGRVLAKVRSQSAIAIRLPSRARFDVPAGTKLSATGGGSRRAYDIELASDPDCGGANACFVAAFTGERAHGLGEPANVRLARGVRGRYRPLSCGASCSPPSISWFQHGVLYFVQARLAVPAARERAAFVALADSAIRHGPR